MSNSEDVGRGQERGEGPALEPWSLSIEFDEEKARANGYDVDELYVCVGKNIEKYGNERVGRGTWRAAEGGDVIDAQSLAISKISRLGWAMQNIKSLTFREDDEEICDGLEMLRHLRPETVVR